MCISMLTFGSNIIVYYFTFHSVQEFELFLNQVRHIHHGSRTEINTICQGERERDSFCKIY